MGYTMKHTNGKKSDTSSFPFKIDAPSATSDSPVKLGLSSINSLGGEGHAGNKIGLMGKDWEQTAYIYSGGMVGDGVGKETRAQEAEYGDVLAAEGLERNMWGNMGFGGGNSSARKARINELKEQDAMGIDRERINSRGGVTAGPA